MALPHNAQQQTYWCRRQKETSYTDNILRLYVQSVQNLFAPHKRDSLLTLLTNVEEGKDEHEGGDNGRCCLLNCYVYCYQHLYHCQLHRTCTEANWSLSLSSHQSRAVATAVTELQKVARSCQCKRYLPSIYPSNWSLIPTFQKSKGRVPSTLMIVRIGL